MDPWITRLKQLTTRAEATLFGAVLLAVVATYGFLKLAEHIGERRLGAIDRWLLQLTRTRVVRAADSTLADVALNLTSLGGVPVLTLLVTLVVGFLLVRREPLQALWVALTTTGGGALSSVLKETFMRARPDVVEPVARASGFSFPSGHALASAVVYLTLGAMIAANVQGRRMKAYVLSVSLLLTGVVGVTRVLLAVHYPSDVLAGWMAGLAWALLSWVLFELLLRHLRRRAGHEPL